MSITKAGTWVEIQQVVLSPAERAPSVPEDTKKVPYVMRVSGFLLEDAQLGQTTRIKTIIGRELEGELITVNPITLTVSATSCPRSDDRHGRGAL